MLSVLDGGLFCLEILGSERGIWTSDSGPTQRAGASQPGQGLCSEQTAQTPHSVNRGPLFLFLRGSQVEVANEDSQGASQGVQSNFPLSIHGVLRPTILAPRVTRTEVLVLVCYVLVIDIRYTISS